MPPPEPPSPDPAPPTPARAVDVPTAADMHDLGARLAALLRPGDLVVLTGDLGAGKTTLTQGIGAGLGVRGPVLSPTFVIARAHPDGRVPLVHVDAYRLGGHAEVDDLDLDAALPESVTVVEWGEGLVEHLATDRLQLRLERSTDEGEESRRVTVCAYGDRWRGVDLDRLSERVDGRRAARPAGP